MSLLQVSGLHFIEAMLTGLCSALQVFQALYALFGMLLFATVSTFV